MKVDKRFCFTLGVTILISVIVMSTVMYIAPITVESNNPMESVWDATCDKLLGSPDVTWTVLAKDVLPNSCGKPAYTITFASSDDKFIYTWSNAIDIYYMVSIGNSYNCTIDRLTILSASDAPLVTKIDGVPV